MINDLIVDIEDYFYKRGWVTTNINSMVNCICMNMFSPQDALAVKTKEFFGDKLCIHPFYFVADNTKNNHMTKDELGIFKKEHAMMYQNQMVMYDKYIFEHIGGLLINYLKDTNNDYGMHVTSHHFSSLVIRDEPSINNTRVTFGTWEQPRLYYFNNAGGVFEIKNNSNEYKSYFSDFINK